MEYFRSLTCLNFFYKESLLDCMYTLDKKANIDHKCYKIWYKLNENARIYMKKLIEYEVVKMLEFL